MAEARRKSKKDMRRTPRRVYERPIGLLRHGEYNVVEALQLSEGGMLFQVKPKFEIKDHIVATLILPSGGAVVARGELLYELPTTEGMRKYGVKFIDLGLHLRRWIRAYVSAKTQAEAEKEADEF